MPKKAIKRSKAVIASQQRENYGPSDTIAISVRIPCEDLDAIKELALASNRPYQQLIVIALQQYIDRIVNFQKE